jgi:type VI secretion system protein ImpK
MKVITSPDAYLLSQSREFFSEVIRLKRSIKSNDRVSARATPPNGKSANGNGKPDVQTQILPQLEAIPETVRNSALAIRGALPTSVDSSQPPSTLHLQVRQELLALFRRNAVQVMRVSGTPTDNYFEAQYVMAVFADEVFIHLDWEGKRPWRSNLLESALFQSHVAGELFFEKLERVLRDREVGDRTLGAVYLTALSLGFRGKYHGVNDHGRLRQYRHELFAFVFRQEPDLMDESKVAFPDAYVQNLRKEKKRKLTNPRVWLGVLALVVLGYLAASHLIWLSLTSRLEQVNKQIVEIENRLDTTPPPRN